MEPRGSRGGFISGTDAPKGHAGSTSTFPSFLFHAHLIVSLGPLTPWRFHNDRLERCMSPMRQYRGRSPNGDPPGNSPSHTSRTIRSSKSPIPNNYTPNPKTNQSQFYIFISIVAPIPRDSLPEEKTYRTLSKDGSITTPELLPNWLESPTKASLFMSVVVPAFNEEDRLTGMLEEAVNYLERMYGTATQIETRSTRNRKPDSPDRGLDRGWEILLVSDGSTDRTEEVAFRFARDHQLSLHPKGNVGPWTPMAGEGVHIPPGTIRVVSLVQNRGKGGAVTHGMRHVRGQYVVFADADGASKFEDLGMLVGAAREVEDKKGRAVAVGSRAHMVGSEAVVKVSCFFLLKRYRWRLIFW